MSRLAVFLRSSVWLWILFLVVYGGTNWLNSRRAGPYHWFFGWELGIPFVPWMIWVYLSVNLLLSLALFVLDAAALRTFARVFALTTLAGAAVHLLAPTRLGFPRPDDVPGYPVYRWLYAVELPYNMFPSLHVTYSAMTALILGRQSRRMRGLVYAWAGLMAASVLLVHQHHIADVISGLALAWISYRFFLRLRRKAG